MAALAAVAAGVAPCLPGLLHAVGVLGSLPPAFKAVYDVAYFVGIGVAAAVYLLLMAPPAPQAAAA